MPSEWPATRKENSPLDSDQSRKKVFLGISAEVARNTNRSLGVMWPEVKNNFVIEGASFEKSNLVTNMVEKADLPFVPDKFQLDVWHALANKRSVILTAPCSSGKFIVASQAADLMRMVTGVHDGVAIGIMPLSAIMEETVKNNGDVGYMTSEGNIHGEENSEVKTSDTIRNLASGKYKLVILHAETILTPEGQQFLDELEINGKLVFVFVDELHSTLLGYWGGNFRRKMLSVPAEVRARTVEPWVPILGIRVWLIFTIKILNLLHCGLQMSGIWEIQGICIVSLPNNFQPSGQPSQMTLKNRFSK